MTVSELIKLLRKFPKDLDVIYGLYSEQVMLNEEDIIVAEFCHPRADGWVQNKRPDKPSKEYLRLPGN